MGKHDNWKENTYGYIFQTTGGDEPAMELPKSQKHRHQVPKIFSWFSFSLATFVFVIRVITKTTFNFLAPSKEMICHSAVMTFFIVSSAHCSVD